MTLCAFGLSRKVIALHVVASLTLAVYGVGCSESSSQGNGASGGTSSGGTGSGGNSANNGKSVWGDVSIQMVPKTESAEAHNLISGNFYDRAPIDELYAVKLNAGDCELLTPVEVFCEETCTAKQSCSASGTCEDKPVALNAGVLTVAGVSLTDGGNEFTMKSVGTVYQPVPSVALDYPPCIAGKDVKLSGTLGGSAVEVSTKCNEPLALIGTDPLPFEKDTPFNLEWTAPKTDVQSRISVKIDISHHGGTKGIIRCETADTGSLSIDGSLVSGLIELRSTGFPYVQVTRTASGSVDVGDGQVSLNIYSYQTQQLLVPGIVSCNVPTDCPTDKPACNLTTKACE